MKELAFILSLFAALPLSVWAAETRSQHNAAVCKDFKKLLGKSDGISRYWMSGVTLDDGTIKFQGLDIDGDGKSDDVRLFCPGSGSLMPADYCELNIRLSSGGNIHFEEARLSLVRYRSKVFVVTSAVEPESIFVKHRVYNIDKAGLTLICSQL